MAFNNQPQPKSLAPGLSTHSLVSMGMLLMSGSVYAQQAPNAGSLLKEQPKPFVQPAAPSQMAPVEPAAKAPAEHGPKVLVKGFRVQGNLLIPEAELQAQIESAIGKELSFVQLHSLTLQLTGYYIQKGYLARVFLPPQDIKDGIVTIQIVEGKRGSVKVDAQGKRIDGDRLREFMDAGLPQGDAIDLNALDKTMRIVNELPGVDAKMAIATGKEEGQIGLVITAKDKPLLGYAAALNNGGSRGTGEYQAIGSLSLNNPTGHFDAASLLLSASEGSAYLRADYRIAVGNRGLQLGVNASHLDYKIVQSGLTALKPKGNADTFGVSGSYPLVRRANSNLSVSGGYDDKTLIDRTDVGETSHRHNTVANLGLGGYTQGVGAVYSFATTLTVGNSDQRNAAARTADDATRKSQGGFTKLGYNLAYLRALNEHWNLNAKLGGQFASKNLDSSERMSLGGPNAVRAYPVGESSGDEAHVASLDLIRKMSDRLTLSVFVDSGMVVINKNTWANWNAGNPSMPNSYVLSGMGAGADWRINSQVLLSASLSTPVGRNPGRDASGNNSDGSPQSRLRGWLALTAQF